MKQLQLKQIGLFVKTHGIHGELVLSLKEGLEFDLIEDILKEGDAVFVEIDGIPVPFFIAKNGIGELNNQNILVKFDDVVTSKVSQFVSSRVFLEKSKLKKMINLDYESFEDLIGYEVSDIAKSFIGRVFDFIDLKGNPMFTIKIGQKSMMLPINSDFIRKIDDKKKTIVVELPDGYLETML